MRLLKILIIAFFCIILSNTTTAQFTFDRNPNGTNKSIIFSNGTKYDLSSNNPFLLDRPADDQSNAQHTYRNVSISEIKTAKDPSLFKWRKDKIPDEETLVGFYTFHQTSFEDGFVAVSYIQLVYNTYDALIGNTSKIIVFDSLGNNCFEKQFNKDCLSVNITSDGKTLSFYVGAKHDESLGALNRTCATFYNISDDSTLFKLYAEDSTYIGSMGGYNNILFVKMINGYMKENKLYFFISETKTLYNIVLTDEQHRRIYKFNNQGIILGKSPSDKTIDRILLFTRDFRKESKQ